MRRRVRIIFALACATLLATLWCGSALAVEPSEMLSNPKLEARARTISRELRCLVCQNESIDDSNASLAHDLRVLVRKRLLAGDTNEQVKQYIVARYGDYVLLKPPFKPETYLLWFGPLIILMAAGGTALIYLRHRRVVAEAPTLSSDETQRLTALLDSDETSGKED